MPNLAGRMLRAIERSGLSQAEVARRMGYTPQAVHQWIKTGRIAKENLAQFAEVTGVTLDDLLGNRANTSKVTGVNYRKIPLVSWVQAGKKNPVVDPYHPGAPEEWEEVTVTLSKDGYALRVRGDSMVAPDGTGFPEGTIIVIDPALEAKNGDYVVVRFSNSDEATFKRLVVDGPNKLLKALNPTYPTIQVTEDARLAGVVVEYVKRGRLR